MIIVLWSVYIDQNMELIQWYLVWKLNIMTNINACGRNIDEVKQIIKHDPKTKIMNKLVWTKLEIENKKDQK